MPVNKASIDWTKVKSKPTTLTGFGITDALANGQTWQNLTASRAYGTTYTNTTGKPILVSISGSTISAVASSVVFTVDGAAHGAFGMSQAGGITNGGTIIVPAGSTYSASSGNFSLGRWSELR
jgi:hypothetical protein